METKDSDAIAFARSVRLQAQSLVQRCISTKDETGQNMAFSLLRHAAQRERELLGLPVKEDEDGEDREDGNEYDLREFNTEYGSDDDTPKE